MKIDGKDIADWGLKVISYEGLLNLPSRREPTHYYWGDFIEPLTNEGDIEFHPHTFSLAFFYSQALLEEEELKGSTLEGLLDYLSPLIQWQVRLETPYKNTRAKLKEIKERESFQGGRAGRFILEFEEQRQPSYSYPKDLLIVDRKGLLIDHYHVEENFALILEDFKESSPVLKDSPAAIYQKEELSALKGQVRIHLKLSGRYLSLGVMAEKIEQFKALFASAGTRVIVYKGYEYYSYLTSGIQIKTPREDLAEVVLTLNVTDKMKSWNANL